MKQISRLLPLTLTLALFCTGCALPFGQTKPAGTPAGTPSAALAPTPSPSLPAEPTPAPAPTPAPDQIETALAAMTTEEKVGQLLMAGIEGTTAGEDARAAIQDDHVGGIILFSRNMESAAQVAALTDSLKKMNGDGTPLFLSVDEEGGRVTRLPPELTPLASMYSYGLTGDAALVTRAGETLAELCSALGYNMDFSPVLDIWSNPKNTVIGDRAFGTTASAVTSMSTALLVGFAKNGTVIPVVKHFPGHGDTDVDSHVGLPVVTRTLEQLKERELIPFQNAVDLGTPAVMVGHILMKAIDPDYPASLSRAVVTGLLREEMGFAGVVTTDDLTMGAVSDTWGMGEAAVLAVEAGCDVLLVCHKAENLASARDALLDAVSSGRITQERLDESVRRILALKERYGLTNDPVPAPDTAALNAAVAQVLPGS